MCVAVPLKIREIQGQEAEAEAFGAVRRIRVDLLPGLKPGDYVIVHAGIAIARIRESEAEENLQAIRDVIEAEASIEAPNLHGKTAGNREEKHASGI